MSDATHRLWPSGRDRFAVTPRQQAAPVLGYVSRSSDASWKIERAGKILPVSYASSSDAAAALMNLPSTVRRSEGRLSR